RPDLRGRGRGPRRRGELPARAGRPRPDRGPLSRERHLAGPARPGRCGVPARGVEPGSRPRSPVGAARRRQPSRQPRLRGRRAAQAVERRGDDGAAGRGPGRRGARAGRDRGGGPGPGAAPAPVDARRGARRRRRVQADDRGRPGGRDRPDDRAARAARPLGAGELQGDPDRPQAPRPEGARRRRRVPRRGAARRGGELLRRDRLPLHAASARQRQRKLHQGGAAAAGARAPPRPAAGHRPPSGHERRRHRGHAVMTTAGATFGSEARVNKWFVATAVALGALLEIIDTSIVNVALADMQAELGATLNQVSWVVSSYAVANVIILPLSAWLGMRFGKKKYFLFSLVGFTAASVLCGLATTLPMLIAARVLQGLMGGGLLAKAQAILFETFPREEQAAAQGFFGAIVIAGPVIGPTLGGYIVTNIGWRWIFFINVPVGIVAVILTIMALPQDAPSRDRSRVDWL